MAPRTIRWGILATGGIATTFTKDLLCDPTTRGVENIKHTVAAAASSSSASRAKDFLKEVNAPSDAKAYGSYEELVKDSNVEIVYVATPHSHHYQNVMLALEHGKHVLCEKAFTVNAAQLKKLVEVARKKVSLFTPVRRTRSDYTLTMLATRTSSLWRLSGPVTFLCPAMSVIPSYPGVSAPSSAFTLTTLYH